MFQTASCCIKANLRQVKRTLKVHNLWSLSPAHDQEHLCVKIVVKFYKTNMQGFSIEWKKFSLVECLLSDFGAAQFYEIFQWKLSIFWRKAYRNLFIVRKLSSQFNILSFLSTTSSSVLKLFSRKSVFGC